MLYGASEYGKFWPEQSRKELQRFAGRVEIAWLEGLSLEDMRKHVAKLPLADVNPVYEEVAFKFLENFIWIAYAMDKAGENQDDMWDEQDGFYYDVLRMPHGEAFRLKVRSMVRLLQTCSDLKNVFEVAVLVGDSTVQRHARTTSLPRMCEKELKRQLSLTKA
jgi:hypothetical protein